MAICPFVIINITSNQASTGIASESDFSPTSIRHDLTLKRSYIAYVYSASELLDTAADYFFESAKLVHDNDRKWRIYRDKIKHFADERK